MSLNDPLAPLRQALLARAHADADRWLAEADAETEARLAEAERRASALRAEARAQGEADTTAALVAERARVRQRARSVVLTARREAYETLRQRVRDEVASWAGDPDLRERLAARARAALGPAARLSDAPGGGVVAEADGRRAAYALDVLADRAVDGLGADVEGLWAP